MAASKRSRPSPIFDLTTHETRMSYIDWGTDLTLPKHTVDLIERNTGRKIKRNADGSALTSDVDALLAELRAKALEQFYAIGNNSLEPRYH